MPGLHEANYSDGATTKTAAADGDFHLKKLNYEDGDFHLKKLNYEENKSDDKYCQVSEELQEDDEEFSFSRAFNGVNTRRFSADDAFDFKPVFPIFHDNLLFAAGDGDCSMDATDRCPFPGGAKKVFVKMPHINPNNLPTAAGPDGLSFANDENKMAPKGNDKSNLAGFSKIWKFKGLIHRRKSAAVTSAQENYLIRRAMAEERQKAYLAHRTVVAGGVHSNVTAAGGGLLTRKVHYPF